MKDGIVVTDAKKANYRYVRLGKFDLNHYKLKENILLLKYPVSRAPVGKIRATKISDEYKALLHDLMDTQKINTVLQRRLNKSESALFELMIRLAGLTEQLDYKKQVMTVDDYIHRFDIARCELSAGNDSSLLKEELIELIEILNGHGKIDDSDSKEFISMLK
jgi:hypothetical protein